MTMMMWLLILMLPLMLISSLTLLFSNKIILLNIPLLLMNISPASISLLLDWQACLFAFTVMLITSSILKYSMEYIPPTEHKRFMIVLMLFVSSMIILIFSNNIIFILLGWDGLGLSSYILVIYYNNANANASGTITILSNRVGDIAILLAIASLVMSNSWNITTNANFPTITLLLLLTAAISKSAQFPFSAWLPAAMAAPTPISALVHSSTLVTAGTYLMIRVSSNNHPILMITLLMIATLTSLLAGLSANWEQDMKKIIALSTLSQIAIMMFAVAINAPNLAFFHLITHALFKSTMFLCAGAIIHNSSYQDMRSMASIFKTSPPTTSTLGISSMALMGLPFMAGFYSKDAIMEMLLFSKMNITLLYIMLLSIGLTATYTLRLSLSSLNLMMKSKPDVNLPSSKTLSTPITLMAPCSIIAGSSLTWFTLSSQTFIISQQDKWSTISFMLLGILTGITLNFKSKTHSKLGKLALPLWFIHNLTTNPFMKLSFLGPMAFQVDNTWHEKMSAQGLFISMKYYSKTNPILHKNSIFIMTMVMISPLFLL